MCSVIASLAFACMLVAMIEDISIAVYVCLTIYFVALGYGIIREENQKDRIKELEEEVKKLKENNKVV
jgi:general stress protein CsbA